MVNVLGPTGDRPSRPVLGAEPPDAWLAVPLPVGEPPRPGRPRRPSTRQIAGAVAVVALLLAGGAVVVGTGAFHRGGRDGDLDTASGAVAAAAPSDAGLARWAELNGTRFHRPPRPRPRPGRTTTTGAVTVPPAPDSSGVPGTTSPPPAAPSSSVVPPPGPPATDGGPTTSSSGAASPPTSSVPAPSASTGPSPSPTKPSTTTSAPPSTTSGATVSSPASPPPPPPAGGSGAGSGQVVWEDNFDRLDTGRWSLEHSTYGDGNHELQCYRPENVSVGGGRLVLRAATETYTCPNGSTRQVTSGMVRSKGVVFSPGQALEFRVKLTPADEADQGGLWPGVWSSGFGAGAWPAGGEMDYLEVMTATNPKRSIYSIHYAKADGSHGVTNKPVVGAANFSAAWHTIRYEYGRDGRLTWYLDGQQVFTVTSAPTGQGYPAPFNQPVKEIKINLALGGNPGPLAPGAVGSKGATFEVDYIRVTTL